MREIKFRVLWGDKMLFTDKGDFVIYRGTPRLNEHGDMIGLGGKCSELMQYTGLKDKNGKDVYDGDIINGIAYDGQELHNSIISFMGCDYVVSLWEGNARGFYYLCHVKLETLEVIANIHENHELLK